MRHAPLFPLLVMLAATLLLAGCMVPAPACGPCGPPACAMPAPACRPAPTIAPYCFPLHPKRYAEDMHPVVGPDGLPYLLPESGLRDRMTAPLGP